MLRKHVIIETNCLSTLLLYSGSILLSLLVKMTTLPRLSLHVYYFLSLHDLNMHVNDTAYVVHVDNLR